MTWLARTPSVVVAACIRMLPRIEAEEAIKVINVGTASNGMADPATVRQIVMPIELLARGTEAERPRAPAGDIAALGFGVRRVKRKKGTPKRGMTKA